MDPNAAWQALCQALVSLEDDPTDKEARSEAMHWLGCLEAWLTKGGFPPQVKGMMIGQPWNNRPA